MKQWNSIVVLTAIATLIALLVMGVGTVPSTLAVEAPPDYLTQWGSYGSGNGQFDFPWDLAVDTSTLPIFDW